MNNATREDKEPRIAGGHTASWLLATWFGCGMFPVGPGTVGSLAALLPAAFLVYFDVAEWRWSLIALLAVFTIPGILASTAYARWRGREDPGEVVVDEVLGQWLTLAFATRLSWPALGIAFVLFRVFDIVKPPPVRQAERLREGVGIVADDLVAGALAGLVFYWLGCFNLY
ncbi:MAG: phosphatidylglycerophosphatase A [Bryobacterales bacterium]|nr:phosphatidylglycerophosphatase A [Bryobacterales bacterium]